MEGRVEAGVNAGLGSKNQRRASVLTQESHRVRVIPEARATAGITGGVTPWSNAMPDQREAMLMKFNHSGWRPTQWQSLPREVCPAEFTRKNSSEP